MKGRIKRIRPRRADTPIVLPAFLPGRRGGAGWHITDAGTTTPSTLAIAGIWNVPYGDEVEDKYIRLHELLHAAHSPLDEPIPYTTPEGKVVGVDAILLAEEVRIDGYARGKIGADCLPPGNTERHGEVLTKLVEVFGKTGNLRYMKQAVEFFFAQWMSNPIPLAESPFDGRKLAVGFTKKEAERRQKAIDLIHDIKQFVQYYFWGQQLNDLQKGNMIEWCEVLKLAEYIQDVLDKLKVLLPPDKGDGVNDDLKELRKIAEDVPAIDDFHKAKRGIVPKSKANGPVIWGKFKWKFPKRNRRLPGKKTTKAKWKATDMGVSPRNIHRFTIDGQVFGKRKRVPGGSVLIDDSGSMSWSNAEVTAIIEAAPASVVAAYSGSGSRNEISIIAQDGTWADPKDEGVRPHGYGNEIDMPALEWLAKQSKPRIWVSDAQVVPPHGGMVQAAKECLAFVEKNAINLVPNARAAANVFEGKRAIYR
jgi:hypothetical protein